MNDPTPLQAPAPPLADDAQSRLLFAASPLPLWVYDLETLRFLDVNEVACAKYGYTREEFLAMTILEIRPPEDATLVRESVRNTPERQFNSGVWRHRLKDGRLIYVEITSHELQFRGRLTRMVCPLDVSSRLRAEAALREREAGLRRAQSLTRLAHVVSLPNGHFESWSDNLPGLLGVAAADVPKNPRAWMALVHADDRETFRGSCLAAARSGRRVDFEYRMSQPDGRCVQMHQVIEPIEDALADGTRWFSTLQDVTAQKEAEARVRLLNEELERRVEERTQQLSASNEELARATAVAQKASRAKSEFLSSMSHELRTPLNAILGFGQLLAVSDAPSLPAERQATYASHIVRAGRHLLALINEILDLASIEAGRVPLTLAPVALDDVLAECRSMVEPLAHKRAIALDFPPRCGLELEADRTRLVQVLLNLLSNAIKYNRSGGSVAVRCEALDRAGVRIEVRDSGAGMSAEQLASLFQPFNRLGQEFGPDEGTGIGLVVTKRLVELMNGTIGVESTPGVGSCFRVNLP